MYKGMRGLDSFPKENLHHLMKIDKAETDVSRFLLRGS